MGRQRVVVDWLRVEAVVIWGGGIVFDIILEAGLSGLADYLSERG